MGNFTGQAKGSWNIAGIPLENATVTIDEVIYDGNEHTIAPVVKLGETTLTEGVDYKIAEGSDTKATDVSSTNYTVTIEGIGKYAGSVSQTWNITPLDITNNEQVTVTLSEGTITCDETAHTQTATVTYGTTTLTENTDFTVSGDVTKTDAGSYTLTVTGIGNFKGTKDASWTIKPATNYYWLALANAENPEATDGILKNQTQIDKDMKVLHGEDSDAKDAVTQEWTNYMNGKSADGKTDQEVRLYTKWYGSDAGTGANQWVEFRIIQVGEHINVSTSPQSGDGSAVTFMATHSLPTAKTMPKYGSGSNLGGWKDSYMRNTIMNGTSTYVQAGMKDLASSESSIKAINKVTSYRNNINKDWTENDVTTDLFWMLSISEIFGSGDKNTLISSSIPSFKVEGKQYAWFDNQGINANDGRSTVNEVLKGLGYARDGETSPKGENASWGTRSPLVGSNPNGFGWVTKDGGPYDTGSSSKQSAAIVPCFAM